MQAEKKEEQQYKKSEHWLNSNFFLYHIMINRCVINQYEIDRFLRKRRRILKLTLLCQFSLFLFFRVHIFSDAVNFYFTRQQV